MTEPAFLTQDEIASLQQNAIVSQLEYVFEHSPYYSRLFRNSGIQKGDLINPSILQNLPFTTKDDLQEFNQDFLAVGQERIIEYCTTSGTMGHPVTIGLTEKDLIRLALNEKYSFQEAGMNENDTLLLMLSLDRMFMAGIAYYLGARSLGCSIIRGGPGNVSMQWDLIRRMKPTALVAVPSFVASFLHAAAERGWDIRQTGVKRIICIGENIRNEDLTPNPLALKIKEDWKVDLFSTYASTEMQTAFTECAHGMGSHHHPDLIHFEIIDENDRSLHSGEVGELVISHLGVEGTPLIRYKTGDITFFVEDQCLCGRNSRRLGPIIGRKQQLIKYKGTTLYPQALFNILNQMENILDYVVHLKKDSLGLDDLKIHIAAKEVSDGAHTRIRQSLQSMLRVVPEVVYLPLKEIQQMQIVEGKRKLYKLIDNR